MPNPSNPQEGDMLTFSMQPIASSAILAAEYDPDHSIMAMQFLSHLLDGKTYMFRPVPEEVWQAFLESDSKGRFFHEHIRSNIRNPIDGGYEWCTAYMPPE